MITKHKHYNQSAANSEFVKEIEYVLLEIDISDLKNSKMKSKYVSEKIKLHLTSKNIVADVEHEVPFIDGKRDCIDIELKLGSTRIIIEIDNLRADQVVKKVLSRTSAFTNATLIYITFCYDSNSDDSHKKECLKYIDVHFKNYFGINKSIEYLAFVPTKHIVSKSTDKVV